MLLLVSIVTPSMMAWCWQSVFWTAHVLHACLVLFFLVLPFKYDAHLRRVALETSSSSSEPQPAADETLSTTQDTTATSHEAASSSGPKQRETSADRASRRRKTLETTPQQKGMTSPPSTAILRCLGLKRK